MTNPKRSAAWYEQVLDSIVDLVLVKGDRSKLLWGNKAFRDLYGMTAEQLEDIVDAPHSDPDDTIQYVKDDHYVFTRGQILEIPAEPVTDANGKVRHVHTLKSPIRDDQGQVIATVGVSRMIHDHDAVASSVKDRGSRKERLNELRTLVQHIPLAVAMFDVHRRFLAHSEAWPELFQCGDRLLMGELYDQTFKRCIELDEAMAQASVDGQAVSLHAVPLRGLRGAAAIVNVELRPWSFPSGEVGGLIVLIHDVTLTKQAQEQLEQVNGELQQFNYRVSHDLLAPLRTVRGFIELCQDELADGNLDAVRSYQQMIWESVDRLSSLVEDVLDLARADMAVLEVESIDVERILYEILDKHRADIQTAGIDVSIECDAPPVRSQRVRVLQVLENLIANAIKYHDPQKSERTLRITSRQGEAGALIVVIEDNGIGFDESLSEEIFEIFKRGTSKYPGSGLGLYIARKHMDRLAGSLRVLSNRDDTIFEVVIPSASSQGNI